MERKAKEAKEEDRERFHEMIKENRRATEEIQRQAAEREERVRQEYATRLDAAQERQT